MKLNREDHAADYGFTLLEVLFALAISGILLMTSMRLLTDQWRGARALKNHLEAHYSAMTTGKTVSDAIRMAKTVEWIQASEVLRVLPMPDNSNLDPTLDTYLIQDLDGDGTTDLYWRHLNVSQPLASYISKWRCTEVEVGLWEIYLEANVEGQSSTWRGVIRRRTYSPVTPVTLVHRVMLAF
ncbi:MAG TPA: prepilin-type N-terminal cleavage/methylation domain-containing protein [Desulfosporosinus sp.]|nr:prepilin-type N-terminal cleavage/methylation domain-containing protein [Desulfosporosinus sp.]